MVEGHVRGYGKFLSGVQKLKQIVKLVYNLYRFPVENLGFNEYRSRAWTVYFANTQYNKFLKIHWGLNPRNLPLGTPVVQLVSGSQNLISTVPVCCKQIGVDFVKLLGYNVTMSASLMLPLFNSIVRILY